MSQAQRCGNCRWWEGYEKDASKGDCAMMEANASKEGETQLEKPIFKMSLAVAYSLAEEPEGTWVETSRFFGCVMWEGKENG